MVAYSGSYSYLPTTGELMLAAFARIQVRRAEILQEHIQNAQNELNLLQVEFSNLGPLSFTITSVTFPLTQGQQTVTLTPQTIMLLDCWISIPNGDGTTSDRIITALSRNEYGSLPDKLSQGAPTSFYLNRQIIPVVYLWPVPDGGGPYTLNGYTFTQPQDAVAAGALNPQAPYRWMDAYVAGLAYRLARIYKPEMEVVRGADSQKAYNLAATQDVENTNLYLSPMLDNYWRI